MALSRADVAVGQGRPLVALERYDAVADFSPVARHREQALWRGAHIAAVDLDDAEAAKERLRRLLSAFPQSEYAPEAWEQLGHLLISADRHSVEAAMAFSHAHRSDPNAPEADERLRRAARAFAEAGQHERALRHWKKLGSEYPEHRARSLIGQALIALELGNVQDALALYEDAIPHANDADVRAMARFGASSCLERLGNLDEAIAALDSADVPAIVADRRRAGISNRREARDGE